MIMNCVGSSFGGPLMLPSLTSLELYTQTLAAQADVLAAAQAWPLLTKSLSDLTDLPDRQQLAIFC